MAKLADKQINYFNEFGFLPLKNVFDPVKILDPIINEYHSVLDNLCSDLYKSKKIPSKYEYLDFGERITRVMQDTGEVHAQYFDFSLPFKGVDKDTPMWFGEAIFNSLVCEEILDVVESIIGPEIFSNPVQHVRIKPPEKFLPKNEHGQPCSTDRMAHNCPAFNAS